MRNIGDADRNFPIGAFGKPIKLSSTMPQRQQMELRDLFAKPNCSKRLERIAACVSDQRRLLRIRRAAAAHMATRFQLSATHRIFEGSHNASAGKAANTSTRMMSELMNGTIAIMTFEIGTSGAKSRTTNRLRPIGGQIRPTSQSAIRRMPNQIGSKPRPVTTGKKIGTVSSSSGLIDKGPNIYRP